MNAFLALADATDCSGGSGKYSSEWSPTGMYLHVGLNLLVLFSASTTLSTPYDVRMIAMDLNYTLQWAWSDSQLNDSANFTAAYTFWNIKDDERSYKYVCTSSRKHWCDFTPCKLYFKASFQIRVRAEAAGKYSNWTRLRFTPDEDGLLGPPSGVNMQGDVEMVILNISKSVMNSLMKLQYEVQYYEQQQPDLKHMKIYNDPYAPLTSLKPWTEYCVQVRVFNKDYSKSSSFTSPQCVSTTGRRVVWLKMLSVLCCVLLLGAVVYICCRLRRKISVYQTPNSILGLPLDHPPLLEAHELSCSIIFVSAPTPWLESSQLLLQEQDGTGKFQAVSCQGSNSSEQDSGIGSGEES
ncbi:interferon alpha/beta receptor 1a-like [Pygocentrus nattereri]|uniref:Fibronectin type-III domain-containing protein n=1 Tax=Pygocentrus nattereri TaxID=42514 RepID=A0AAR2JBW3_PYGNA|nr:interferon alpha/beta receptor 1a-like [Pygocentrus nattereri]